MYKYIQYIKYYFNLTNMYYYVIWFMEKSIQNTYNYHLCKIYKVSSILIFQNLKINAIFSHFNFI